jgi:hypothetical protein
VRAGEKGDPTALSNIAHGYMSGVPLPKDERRAMYYLITAIQRANATQQRDLNTAAAVENLTKLMSIEDLREIKTDAEKWRPGDGSLAQVLDDAARRRDQGGAP